MKLISFGEIVWDVHGDNVSLGGAPLNLAVHVAMHGEEVMLVSAVGKDKLGYDAIEIAESYGVDIKNVKVLESCETSKCFVTDGENGLPSYRLEDNTAFDRIGMPDISEYADVISFGTLSLRHESNREVIARMLKDIPHGNVFCDVNLRAPFYSADTVKYCLSSADIVKISDEELPEISRMIFGDYQGIDETAKRLSGSYDNIKLLVITLGAKGSMCLDVQSGRICRAEAKKVKAVSTVGAGDSFSASFLVRYMRGHSIADCLEYASEISAMVCSSEAAFSKDMAVLTDKLNGGVCQWK